jgi:hypothetical protein
MQRLRVLAAGNTKGIFKRLDTAARRHNLGIASKTQDVLTQLIQSALNVYMQEVCK